MRYKEFNANAVGEKCINLFWRNGFVSCPVSQIVEVTRVNRYSLYEEFENKEGILDFALNLYYERYAEGRIELLKAEGPLDEVLMNFFMSYARDNSDHPPGCFIIHIATELADTNDKIRDLLDAYLNKIQIKIELLLQRFPETGSDVEFLGSQLIGLYCTAMCYSLIQTQGQRRAFIENGMRVILANRIQHA